MNNTRLNKYIHVVDNKDKYILFNTFNESVITLQKENLTGNKLINLKEAELDYLQQNDFTTESNTLLQKYLQNRKANPYTLSITISLTQACNLACSYCSQNNAKNNLLITEEVLEDTVKYIQNRMNATNYKQIAINFFGGEPLLAKKQILYFKKTLEKLYNQDMISYAVVTNGVLLDEEFLNNFENINVKITLTEKDNHDKFRVFRDGNGSYDIIFNNLKKVANYFTTHTKSNLSLRYNVDNINNNFPSFFNIITTNFPYIKYIELAPVYNFDFNSKTSNFTKKEFTKFYLEALELMIKKGFMVEFPTTRTTFCKAYSKDAIKVFADGSINLCNGCDCNFRRTNIKNLITKETKHEVFKDILESQLPEKCLNCDKLFLCSGIQLCRFKQCEFLIYDLDDFLKFYIEIIKQNPDFQKQFYASDFIYD